MIEKLQELQKPEKISVNSSEYNSRQAVITVSPLERGFGITLGNSYVVYCCLYCRAHGHCGANSCVVHEFSSIAGVREDVTDLILNVKGVAVSMEQAGSRRSAWREMAAAVAGMISETAGIEIMNPDHDLSS